MWRLIDVSPKDTVSFPLPAMDGGLGYELGLRFLSYVEVGSVDQSLECNVNMSEPFSGSVNQPIEFAMNLKCAI